MQLLMSREFQLKKTNSHDKQYIHIANQTKNSFCADRLYMYNKYNTSHDQNMHPLEITIMCGTGRALIVSELSRQ